MTVSEAVRIAKLSIENVAGEEAFSQARELVAFLIGIDPAVLMLHHHVELTREQIVTLGEYIERRKNGEPLQYILSQWSFMGLPFIVDEHVLIPRQDTERLCELACEIARESGYTSALDLCCGSGCIGISVASRVGLAVTCTDISEEATRITAENAELNGVKIEVLTGDLFAPVREKTFDMIVCNPPYLSDEDMAHMQRELQYEPRLALYGGMDGLDFYRRIAAAYRSYLETGGSLLMEIGSTQAEAVRDMFPGSRCISDYAGNSRIIAVLDQE